MANIGMVLDSFYPEDGRVTKEATSLKAAGHEVYLICLQRVGEKRTETLEVLTVYRIPVLFPKVSLPAYEFITSTVRIHPLFRQHLPKFIKAYCIDVLHVHDLPLAATCRTAATTDGIPWVLDLHENYPAGLQVWSIHKTGFLQSLKRGWLYNYNTWSRYERKMIHAANHVIGVVEEMKLRLVRNYRLNQSKISVVTNSEWRNFFDQFELQESILSTYPSEFVILYLGYFGPHRGVDTVIKAMPGILKEVPNARFVIVGRGSVQAQYEALASKLGVNDQVTFLGFKPYREVGSWMTRADVNIVPHKRNEHTDHTIPHKLFQSMLSGRPTVVSSSPPLARIALETGGALVFEAESPSSVVACISDLFHNVSLRQETVRKALTATKSGSYNWDSDSDNLVQVYKSLGLGVN